MGLAKPPSLVVADMAMVEFTAATPPTILDGCIPIPRPPVAIPAISACCVDIGLGNICVFVSDADKEKTQRIVSNQTNSVHAIVLLRNVHWRGCQSYFVRKKGITWLGFKNIKKC